MKFVSYLVANRKIEVEKALTLSQIKELLEYVAYTKRSVYLEPSFDDETRNRFRIESSALCQLAATLEDYVD